MSEETYYVVKGLLVFGGIFTILIWQWIEVNRDIKRAKDKDAADPDT